MQELEKILEEINEEIKASVRFSSQRTYGLMKAKEIIHKHMNDGWIPVEEEEPPTDQRLQATILHHEWIADYDSGWVPEEEKTRHSEYTEVCEIACANGVWRYMCREDGYELSEAHIHPKKDISVPIDEIIAWRPLPEPYRPVQDTAGGHHD